MRPEAFLFPLRLVILMPVAGLLLGSVYFAYLALLEALAAWQSPLEEALPRLVGAVDLGLLAAVFLIFGLGLFELFIQKLGQVIVMILVVKFFEKALAFKPKEALDFLLFAGGVALLVGALWLTKAKE
jgi:uncharacterized membrane protein YqhA